MTADIHASDFPKDFLWGVATAAYQIEGGAQEGGRGPSIWDTFSHTPGKTRDGDNGDIAVDHYHRYQEDVDLMAEIGVNAYRFSISWSRLIPDGAGDLNPEGVAFYRDLCAALSDRGIVPTATLYHWDLPQALQDRGGWENPDSVHWFANYAEAAKKALGDQVRIWTTFNEPWCVAFLGHSAGEHAPGLKQSGTSFVVAHNLMLAHHAAIKAMRSANPHPDDKLGVVLNLIPAWPADDSAEAGEAAEGIDAVHNKLFAEAVLNGRYPDEIRNIHRALGIESRITVSDLEAMYEPIDFLGVNYYNINRVSHSPTSEPLLAWPGVPGATVVRPPGELTAMGWAVEPQGLTWMLDRVTRWAPGLPLYITENGAAYPDEVDEMGNVQDDLRLEYVSEHIKATHAAIAAGANVKGYFLWSLLDNFEWARGYGLRFGIVRVDYETLERTIKSSGTWYQTFLRS
jgi:beta-glucosidase